jgi:hypothetical protein
MGFCTVALGCPSNYEALAESHVLMNILMALVHCGTVCMQMQSTDLGVQPWFAWHWQLLAVATAVAIYF